MSQLQYRTDIRTLKSTDTLSDALQIVRSSQLGALPVLRHRKLIGMLHADDAALIKAAEETPSQTLGSVKFADPPSLRHDAHCLDAIKQFRRTSLSLLPVVEADATYLGAILRRDAEQQLLELFSLQTDGILIELETPASIRLSEVIRLLEQNETRLFTVGTRPVPDSTDRQFLLFHLYTPDAYRLQRTLERYGYLITYNSHAGESILDDAALRAQEFLRYLEL
ncbi:MAG: CBS domain-containing protein [Chloroherpetonaceae bacterium]|nr:CBS domain-containing protein [Chloroherpetonaceae bacterium]MCS7212366.1 CBS domain-containing protein [Chloroherpetonaceae bacterium]MDW8018569.1 CBS domain-containing protein [Chloroherpetonaceae bacterium]MDW8467331.1 CBS domain-containing protein [Chloroherpetonaceae bacterium]